MRFLSPGFLSELPIIQPALRSMQPGSRRCYAREKEKDNSLARFESSGYRSLKAASAVRVPRGQSGIYLGETPREIGIHIREIQFRL